MKEINEAYDTLMKGGSASASSASASYQGQSSAGELNEVRELIRQGRLDAAEARLDGIATHNAEWYYLRGVIAQRRGWMDEAAQNFRIACNMDPGNYEYRNAANAASGGGAYTYRQREYGSSQGDDLCGLCSTLMCLNCLCDCCR